MDNNSRNLPILRAEATAPLCSICVDPGRCCRRFHYHKSFWKDDGLEAAQAVISKTLPFIVQDWALEVGTNEKGREYAYTICSCPNVTPEGRCSIYEDRPWTCRSYTPGSDRLCVFSSMSGIHFWQG